MAHTLTGLRTFLGLGKRTAGRRSTQNRSVMMRVTLDAQHATPLRQALTRDCAGQPWTIRVTPLHGTGQVRLSLYLPKDAVNGAIERVASLAPTAELGQVFEVPETPTEAWRDLMHPATPTYAEPTEPTERTDPPNEPAARQHTLAQLLSQDDVLLGLDVVSREDLFARVGRLVEQRYGLPASEVAAGLEAREALGSTGLGQGVAIPHAQIKGLRRAMTLYVRPTKPIPFDTPDGKAVTDVIILLVPEWANTTHLHLLADVAQHFCDHHFREQLHTCVDAQAVCSLFVGYEAPSDAARNAP